MNLRLIPALIAAVLALAPAGAAPAAAPAYRTVVVFGDTQHLTWAGRAADHQKFVAMMDWVIANREAENIDFVLQVGDAIQNGFRRVYPLSNFAECAGAVANPSAHHVNDCRTTDANGTQICLDPHPGCFVDIGACYSCARALWETQTEWANFNQQWWRLRVANIPNANVHGNHDNDGLHYDPTDPLDTRGYAQFYGPAQMSGAPGYVESFIDSNNNGLSHAWKFDLNFDAGTRSVLVVGMSYEGLLPPKPLDDHAAWANALIDRPALASLPVIFLKHRIFNSLNHLEGVNRTGWSQFGAPNAGRIFMNVWGHNELGELSILPLDPAPPSISYDTLFVRSNWQGHPESKGEIGLHWLNLIRFYNDPNGIDEVEIEAFSPWRAVQEPNSPETWFDRDPEREGVTWMPRQGFSIDFDIDHDGVTNSLDNCPLQANSGRDSDADTLGDECDNCPYFANGPAEGSLSQADIDGDSVGDRCDSDIDGDGHLNWDDNCPLFSNAVQNPNVSTSAGLEGLPCDCLCGDVDADCFVGAQDPVGIRNLMPYLGFPPCVDDLAGLGTCGSDPTLHIRACDIDANGKCDAAGDAVCLNSVVPLLAPGVAFPITTGSCSYAPDNCRMSLRDIDEDGVLDSDDNCPLVPNPGQESSTQSGLAGLGCACLCGDVNNSCSVNGLDLQSILFEIGPRLSLQPGCTDTAAGVCGSPQNLEVRGCDVNESGTCSALDALLLKRDLPHLAGTPSFPLPNGYSPFLCAQDSPDPSPAQ